MDTNTLYFLVAVLCTGCALYGIHSFNAVRKRHFDLKIAQSRKMSAVRAGSRNEPEPSGNAPDWLFDVAEELGFGDYLESEEMPEELKRLIPMAKAFIESGGAQKLLSGSGGPQQTGFTPFPADRPY
jgi:hypothetical protein